MKQTLSITRKELESYFGSPMALIFVAIFLVTVHYSFFQITGFFVRGTADVRPLFQWMPLLLIFLIATLTMRLWSEEQQTGTLEVLLTLPVKLTELVFGKFLAVLILVCVALLMTISLPVTAALLGQLDWGPVIGGYLAAILVAAAYSAIGLYISSRTDNQIVSLLLTAIVCGAFYLVGSPLVAGLGNTGITEFLRGLGTGSRFESIERGVIDLRDIVYYLTLTFIFLALNINSLDAKRWGIGARTRPYRFNRRLMTVLIVINLIVFNVLMVKVGTVRADLTQSGQYSLAPVTRDLLNNLQEPLLIRGYFSQDTHPLLAPLIPQVEDMLNEYKLAANNKLSVEFVDPIQNTSLATEANQTYGINPLQLQFQDRGKTSVVNAYVSILIRYGDQNTVLSLLDMVDVQTNAGATDVHFRNLEYDLTNAIQKTVFGFQDIDTILAGLKNPAQLTLYVTAKTLPDTFKTAPDLINSTIGDIVKKSNGKLTFNTVDAADIATQKMLADKYQIQPIASGLFSSDVYYLDMVLEADGKTQVIYPPDQISKDQITTDLTSALKRVSPGFLQVVGVWTPPSTQPIGPQGQTQGLQAYNTVQQQLGKSFSVRNVTLTTGLVPNDVNALVIMQPQGMTDIDRYAVDQYLMRGGSVFIAAGNYILTQDQQTGGIGLQNITDGLQAMLTSYGITVEQKLVLDNQNAPFLAHVVGAAAGQYTIVDHYPQTLDVRADGMDQGSPIVAKISALTMPWVSPITLDDSKLKGATVTKLLQSSPNSWTTTTTTTDPDPKTYANSGGFPIGTDVGRHTVAVMVQGSLTSYFQGKTLPFATTPTPVVGAQTPTAVPLAGQSAGFIAKSPDTTRLVVVGSTEFLDDTIFKIEQQMGMDRSPGSIQLVQNSVDSFTQDAALANIRAKGNGTHLLNPVSDDAQKLWEAGNYLFALILIIALGIVWQVRRRSQKPMRLIMPKDYEPQKGEA